MNPPYPSSVTESPFHKVLLKAQPHNTNSFSHGKTILSLLLTEDSANTFVLCVGGFRCLRGGTGLPQHRHFSSLMYSIMYVRLYELHGLCQRSCKSTMYLQCFRRQHHRCNPPFPSLPSLVSLFQSPFAILLFSQVFTEKTNSSVMIASNR